MLSTSAAPAAVVERVHARRRRILRRAIVLTLAVSIALVILVVASLAVGSRALAPSDVFSALFSDRRDLSLIHISEPTRPY